MSQSFHKAGRTITLGEEVVVNVTGCEDYNLGNVGEVVKIKAFGTDIKEALVAGNTPRDNYQLGIESKVRHGAWHDLDGLTKAGYGWWVRVREILQGTNPLQREMVVTAAVNFKKKNLKGMPCKLLASVGEKSALVEMEENVGGGGGDGLGRQGHCVLLPKNTLKTKKE